MTAAEVLVKCLKHEGVRYVFGIPGEENLEIVKALRESKQITFIVTRHEQGAGDGTDIGFSLRRTMFDEEQKEAADSSCPMKPQRVIANIRAAMDSEDDILISNGFATMGIAVPGALAAKLLYPDRKALEAGIIPAYDMTSEAAITKLMWVLGQTQNQAEIRDYFSVNLCGEVSL